MAKWFTPQLMKGAKRCILAGSVAARLSVKRRATRPGRSSIKAIVKHCAFGGRSRRRHAGGATMMALDDRLLADIGIRRSDLLAAATGMLDLDELARAPAAVARRGGSRCMTTSRTWETSVGRIGFCFPGSGSFSKPQLWICGGRTQRADETFPRRGIRRLHLV